MAGITSEGALYSSGSWNDHAFHHVASSPIPSMPIIILQSYACYATALPLIALPHVCFPPCFPADVILLYRYQV